MKEGDNVLRILRETKEAIKHGDTAQIKTLSNQTTNTASMTQDPDNIAVAVIIYSIGKILERGDYKNLRGWNNFYRTIISTLDLAIRDISRNNEKGFRKDFSMIQKAINKLSGKLKKYVQEVLRNAKINKASRIYAHGISMAQTADILGITPYELAEYAGKTGISETPLAKTMDSKSRIKLAMEMFS